MKEMVVFVNGKLHVDARPNLNVSDDVVIDANRRFRVFGKCDRVYRKAKG